MKKILAIDGGGIRGTFPAAFLANLEDDLDEPIGRYFDLIAGTSTGGIIAIGLALGIRASEILAFYENKGPAIFAQQSKFGRGRIGRTLHRSKHYLWGPAYSSAPLCDALTEVFGERPLGDASTRLVIPAWHPMSQKVYIYKTAHHPRLSTDYKIPARDIAMATAAAPTYFQKYVASNGVGLYDGGIWAKNPTGIAVVEAIGMLDWPADQIRVLSVGCLENIKEWEGAFGALRGCLKQPVGMLMAGQSFGALGMAQILTGDPHRRRAIYRVSPPVPDSVYKLDDTKRIHDLKERAYQEAREQKPILQPEFFVKTAEEFVPEHRRR